MPIIKYDLQKRYVFVDVPVDYLCFTANTAGSTIKLRKSSSIAVPTLETSTDGINWTTYNFSSSTSGDTITLSNVGDKVYRRNSSETQVQFSTGTSYYFYFQMTGSIAASGNVNYLLCKNSTSTVNSYNFYRLFDGCTALTTPPELPATTVWAYSYMYMFGGCTNLTTTPSLPATTIYAYAYMHMFDRCSKITTLPILPALELRDQCYDNMFYGCSKIKLSYTQTGEYQTPYRIPNEGTGTIASASLNYMFDSTGGTFTGTPSINTTYYTSNDLV